MSSPGEGSTAESGGAGEGSTAESGGAGEGSTAESGGAGSGVADYEPGDAQAAAVSPPRDVPRSQGEDARAGTAGGEAERADADVAEVPRTDTTGADASPPVDSSPAGDARPAAGDDLSPGQGVVEPGAGAPEPNEPA